MKDGLFSLWKGHRPLEVLPAFLSATFWPITSTTSSRALISAMGSLLGIMVFPSRWTKIECEKLQSVEEAVAYHRGNEAARPVIGVAQDHASYQNWEKRLYIKVGAGKE